MRHETLANFLVKAMLLGSLLVIPLLDSMYRDLSIGKVGTYLLVPGVFLAMLAMDIQAKKIPESRLLVIYICFFVWGCVTILSAYNAEVAITTQRRMLVIILMIYPLTSFSVRYPEKISGLFSTLALCALSVILSGLILIDHDQKAELAFASALNRNSYGYYIFSGLISAFFLVLHSDTRHKGIFYASTLSIIGFFMLLATASRGGFIVFSFILFFGTAIAQNNKGRMTMNYIFRLFFYFIIAVGVSLLLYSEFLYQSELETRISGTSSETSLRFMHFIEAFKVGSQNILTGVGGGNYALQPRGFEPGNFSHNMFMEAFASYGIFGPLFVVGMLVEYLFSLARLKNIRSITFQVLAMHYLFLVSFFAYSFLYVPYLSPIFMVTFVIARSHVRTLGLRHRSIDHSRRRALPI